jgi:two-component system, cell cycle sensor histidine kinase and response regulator CckA
MIGVRPGTDRHEPGGLPVGPAPPVRKIVAGSAVALGVLLVVVGASWWTTARMEEVIREADRAQRVVNATTDLHEYVLSIDDGINEYLYSGDARRLERRQADLDSARSALASLRQLTDEHDDSQGQLDIVESLLHHQRDLHDDLIARRATASFTPAEMAAALRRAGDRTRRIHRTIDMGIARDQRHSLAASVARARESAATALVVNAIGGVLGLIVVLAAGAITIRDVAARWRAEELLQEIADKIQEVFFVFSADGRHTLYVNPGYERLWGRPCASLYAAPDSWLDGVAAEDRERVAAVVRDNEWTEREHEYQVVRPDGSVRHVWARHLRFRDRNGDIARHVGTAMDITERKRTEEALRLRERAMEAFVQGVCVTDPSRPDNPIIYVNRAFEPLTGYAPGECLGRNPRFLQGPGTDPSATAEIRAAIHEERPCLVEVLNYRKDGTAFWNALSLAPIHDRAGRLTHFVGVLTDVTPFKRLEAQFLQAQKMEAVGQLAGGVAHDFNNLLTIITGYSDLVLAGLDHRDDTRAMIEEIHKAGERAASLTRQLLAFSRKQVLQPRVLDLNDLVADVQKMLGRLIGEDIQLFTTLSPSLGPVKADPGQIEQILVNLAVNARDAMPGGGKLVVETSDVKVDAASTRDRPELRPGRYAVLRFTDTGCGMDKATLDRIFEPFFTTKSQGQGTGLGLATVYGIVKQSGGYIYAHSEIGKGSKFETYLPVVEEDARFTEAPRRRGPAPGGIETVLLVEDEQGVRELACQVLQMNGYKVLEAQNGRDALQVAENNGGKVDLLLTDVVMPHLGGRGLAEQVATINPGVKVLYMSGYTDDAVIRTGVFESENEFLQKPFTTAALLDKVREVLDKRNHE